MRCHFADKLRKMRQRTAEPIQFVRNDYIYAAFSDCRASARQDPPA
jgi:hypothetical protein